MEEIYYCSSVSGLQAEWFNVLKIQNNELNGFTDKIAGILNFIAKDNDFIFTIGKDYKSGQWFLCERINNGILSSLKGKSMSIYQMKQADLDQTETYWTNKVAIQSPIEWVNEEVITDLFEYLVCCCKSSQLIICFYPEKTNGIRGDDQDLVELAVLKYRIYGENILTTIRQVHPHLIERVIKGVESDAFREYGI